MIKQAYFRGLMQVAADIIRKYRLEQMSQQEKDKLLLNGDTEGSPDQLQDHGFYKGMPILKEFTGSSWHDSQSPSSYRWWQSSDSVDKFAPNVRDAVRPALHDYYKSIGRQNRDFYLKHGHRPPADYKYKTPFPFPNHPKKKQMMLQNQYQTNSNRGQKYKGHA